MKSLKELYGKWKGEKPKLNFSTSIQIRTFELYHKKIDSLSPDDLRFIIIQKFGKKEIVSRAIQHLKSDVLLDANYYEGDLLASIFTLEEDFWEENMELRQQLFTILDSNQNTIFENLNPEFEIDRKLIAGVKKWLN